jgi:hypothetical protein
MRPHFAVRCTLAFTPTWTTARPGGFTPAGSGPDTSCRQKMLESVWKGGPSDGAVDRLRGIIWPNMSDRSRTHRRVARRAPSRNENRGALPKVPSVIKNPFASGCRCLLHRLRPPPLRPGDACRRLDPSHHSRPSFYWKTGRSLTCGGRNTLDDFCVFMPAPMICH